MVEINSCQLAALVDTFHQPGESTPFGIDEDQIESLVEQVIAEQQEYKPICIVKHWMIWRVLEAKDLIVLKADHVISHSLGHRPAGSWVRTSPLVSFRHKAVFETKNTAYLLVGPGTIKDVSAKNVVAFF